MNVIITGVTGMVGEGVLFECLRNNKVNKVLSISRRSYPLEHPKLTQLIIPDFTKLDKFEDQIRDYNACFYCAGISSVGMKEDPYTSFTYNTTLAFAKAVLKANPGISFCYVSGRSTDSTEKGKIMWARVKGRTENALRALSFKCEFNFRPAAMYPFPGQKNWNTFYKIIVRIISFFSSRNILSMEEVGKAMINAVDTGFPGSILEVKDIKLLASK
jgi:hypothetical protein